jgi:hypothetical protein
MQYIFYLMLTLVNNQILFGLIISGVTAMISVWMVGVLSQIRQSADSL